MFESTVEKVKAWREARFLKKHGVPDWKSYERKYDKDFNQHATSIREMFFGYPYIAEIQKSSSLWMPAGWDYGGLQYLSDWVDNECRGKARATIQRTWERPSYHCPYFNETVHKDWDLNEFASDSVFVGFQDERDYLIFLLKWDTA